MGNAKGKPNFDELSKGTKFSAKELTTFFDNFKKDFPDGKIDKNQFEVLYKKMFGTEGDAKEFCGLVFEQYDADHSGYIDFKEFILTLSIASRGTKDEKLLWAFRLYDRDQSGYLTENEIVQVLTTIYKARCNPDPLKAATEAAKTIIKQSDDNKDGRVSEAEFIQHSKFFQII